VPFDVYLNVAVSGVLTGLVYGLMALGLSVIFGVVRVVNFAHGEMMSIAMYLAVVLFSGFHLDPLIMLLPIAAVMFVFGYALQAGLINPFITRPEHSRGAGDHHRQCALDRLRSGRPHRADLLRL
jgi:branched-chain amino acid transport system permease protein